MFALAIILFFVDQITKASFATRDFFIGPLRIHLVKNYGLPFGINSNPVVSLFVVGIIFVALAGYFYRRDRSLNKAERIGLSLVLLGAASNLLDRIMYGYVRDFMDLNWGFVFNFADAYIVVGLLMIVFASSKSTR